MYLERFSINVSRRLLFFYMQSIKSFIVPAEVWELLNAAIWRDRHKSLQRFVRPFDELLQSSSAAAALLITAGVIALMTVESSWLKCALFPRLGVLPLEINVLVVKWMRGLYLQLKWSSIGYYKVNWLVIQVCVIVRYGFLSISSCHTN